MIYIPIWLDLLLMPIMALDFQNINLHSNMVRFIISLTKLISMLITLFTFQYG